MVMAGLSVCLTTLFLGKLEQVVNQYFMHILSFVTDNNPSRMSMKYWLTACSSLLRNKVWLGELPLYLSGEIKHRDQSRSTVYHLG